MKKCPFCAEMIQEEAIKCRYCKEWVKDSKIPVVDPRNTEKEESKNWYEISDTNKKAVTKKTDFPVKTEEIKDYVEEKQKDFVKEAEEQRQREFEKRVQLQNELLE
jgi:hypothetical protein